jgi:hypothetical protein
MNAKQKATELCNKFYNTDTHSNSVSVRMRTASNCALLAVEEILSLKLWGKTDGENDRDFWIKVKAEILNCQPGNEVQCGVGKNNI